MGLGGPLWASLCQERGEEAMGLGRLSRPRYAGKEEKEEDHGPGGTSLGLVMPGRGGRRRGDLSKPRYAGIGEAKSLSSFPLLFSEKRRENA